MQQCLGGNTNGRRPKRQVLAMTIDEVLKLRFVHQCNPFIRNRLPRSIYRHRIGINRETVDTRRYAQRNDFDTCAPSTHGVRTQCPVKWAAVEWRSETSEAA